METTELKARLNLLGIKQTAIPNEKGFEGETVVLEIPKDMDWVAAEKLLPPDIFSSLKNPPKPTINYWHPESLG